MRRTLRWCVLIVSLAAGYLLSRTTAPTEQETIRALLMSGIESALQDLTELHVLLATMEPRQ